MAAIVGVAVLLKIVITVMAIARTVYDNSGDGIHDSYT